MLKGTRFQSGDGHVVAVEGEQPVSTALAEVVADPVDPLVDVVGSIPIGVAIPFEPRRRRSSATQHEATLLLAVEDRKVRAGQILAEGLVRLLVEEGRVAADDVLPVTDGDDPR